MESTVRATCKFLMIFFLCSTVIYADGIFNHAAFNKLLNKHVSEEGFVDYEEFVNNSEFESYIEELSEINLKGFTDNEKLAFYINAYNALTIKNVVEKFPINSPMDVEGFFKKNKFEIAGEYLTLDEIEHEIIGKIEPLLMHFGLVCAAQSCPKLLTKVYRAENVYDQLKENAKVFLSDTTKNLIDTKSKTLYLSEIFKWFKSTFEQKYGTINKAVAILSGGKNIDEFDGYNIKYKKYNWKLNAK